MSERGGPRVVVVGAGISGLVAAWELARGGARVSLLEGGRRLGGKLAGGEVGGVPVDLGAESVLARRPEAVELIRAVGLADDLTHPTGASAGLWIGDAVRALPPTVMGVPADPGAVAGVLGPEAVERIRAEPEAVHEPLAGDVAIGRFVAERMGRAVTDRLVDPLLGGVYAGRADEISLAASVPDLYARLLSEPSLLRAVEQLRAVASEKTVTRSGSSSDPTRGGSAGAVFAGVRGGVHRLVDALAAELERHGAEIRRGSTVRRITFEGDGFRLESGPVPAPTADYADAVVVAAPATPAGRMLAELVPSAAAELAAIEYASLAIVTLAIHQRDWPESASGSGFLVPAVEGRTIKAATYSHRKWDWTAEAGGELAVFRCSVGRPGEEHLLQRPDDELVSVAMKDLGTAIGLTAVPVASAVTRWGGALPQYAVGHLDRVERVESAVERVPGLAVCGAAYRGVGIAACVASGQRAATRVRDHLATLARMAP